MDRSGDFAKHCGGTNGAVRIFAPLRTNLGNLRAVAISKLGWSRQRHQRQRMLDGGFRPRQPGQGIDQLPHLPVGDPQFVKALQLNPELRARAKEMR